MGGRIWLFVTVLLALNGAGVQSAAIIEDQSGTWQDAGMGEYFARSLDDILPPDLFEQVAKEAIIFQNYEVEERNRRTAGGGYMHGKGGTFWRAIYNKQGERTTPRFGIEAAIQIIYDADYGGVKSKRVKGGEWWVQHRFATEDIGFHHDKDEGMASIKSTMKFPEVSTVTYLTDAGGPTLIFNQTTPDGNRDIPVIPHEAFLSFPKKNRHLTFRGNLQHGVVGALALEGHASGGLQLRSSDKRTTLLVNWWKEKPMSPNCNKIETRLVKQLGLYDKEGMTAMVRRYQKYRPTPAPFESLMIPRAKEQRRTLMVPLAGHDILWYDLPKTMRRSLWQIEFAEDQIYGNAARLDLQRGASWLFAEQRAKLIAFIPPGPAEDSRISWLLQISKDYMDDFKLVLADPARTQDAMNAFGLTSIDTPTVAIHATHPQDRKYLMLKADRSRGLTEEAARRMVTMFLSGRLPVLGGNDADTDYD